MPRMFISHSSKDNLATKELLEKLTGDFTGVAFLDIHPDVEESPEKLAGPAVEGMKPGDAWEFVIYRQISLCSVLLAVLSEDWFESKWCLVEFAFARNLGKKIIPYLLPGKRRSLVDAKLRQFHIGTLEDSVDSLLNTLRREWPKSPRGFTLPADQSPFVGMRAMTVHEGALLFGRDDEISELADQIVSSFNRRERLILVIHGESGVGKSSLLCAGLIARLRRQHTHWLITDPFRPSNSGPQRLQSALMSKDIAIDVHSEATLLDDVRIWRQKYERPLLISIDQLEEGLALESHAAHFLAQINKLADLPEVVIVATVRSSYLTSLPSLGKLRDYCLMPLGKQHLGSIIREPAKLVEVDFDEELIDAIKVDIGDRMVLPLLAKLLQTLFENKAGDYKIHLAEYQRLGRDGLTPIASIVQKGADAVYGQLSPEAQQSLREFLVTKLVHYDRARQQFLRQRAPLPDSPELRSALGDLIKEGLLSQDDQSIEVAHEVLFSAWPALETWLLEDKEFLAAFERFKEQLQIWNDAASNAKSEVSLRPTHIPPAPQLRHPTLAA